MSERPFVARILDFNPSRMTSAEADERKIPNYLRDIVGDKRQYPFNIARHFPQGVLWFDQNEPWFFRYILTDPQKLVDYLTTTF